MFQIAASNQLVVSEQVPNQSHQAPFQNLNFDFHFIARGTTSALARISARVEGQRVVS